MEQSQVFCARCGASNTNASKDCFACGTPLGESTHDTQSTQDDGQLLQHRYRLIRSLGEGGFSKVYQAEDTYARRLVALKAVNLQGLNVQEKIEATDAFNREVRMLTHLNQRNLPRLYNHFSDAEHWYMVMDYINGRTLEQQQEERKEQPLPLIDVIELGYILCDVLDYLHHQEPPIIFRDLKPANIMLTPEGHLYLIDFGIARHFKAGQHKDTIPFGSPGYAAPEQYGRAQTTPQADIYSLGAILHQLITGHDPSQSPFIFTPLEDQQTLALHDLNTLIQSMVALDAAQRPATIIHVRHRLQEIEEATLRTQGIYALPHTRSSVFTAQSSIAPRYPATTPFSPMPATPGATQITATNLPGSQQGQVQQLYNPSYYVPQLPGAAPSNIYALISLVTSLIGIVMPLICTSLLLRHDTAAIFITFSLLIAPSVTSIVCGHIGRSIARKHGIGGKAALAGLIIAYIQLGIYLTLILCSTSVLLIIH